MSADLTCPKCKGTRVYGHGKCWSCNGEGRRRPELREWDALKAKLDLLETGLNRFERLHDIQHERLTERVSKAESERDRYREALERLARNEHSFVNPAGRIARAALGSEPSLAERCTCTEPPDLPYDEGCPRHGELERTRRIRSDE